MCGIFALLNNNDTIKKEFILEQFNRVKNTWSR